MSRYRGRWASLVTGAALGVLTLLVTLSVFTILDDPLRHRPINGDETYFVWCGWNITKGLAPYRDFIEFKPPIFFLVHALALKLYGFDGLEFRRLFHYFPLASLLGFQVALLVRKADRWLSLAIVLGLVNIWVNPAFHDTALSDSESVGLSFYFLGAGCFLAQTRRRPWLIVLGTALLVCCFQCKEPFLPVAFCTWLASYFLAPRIGGWKRDLRTYIGWSTVGALLVVAGLVLYMGPTGSLRAYVDMVQRYAVVYRDARKSYCVVGGVFQPTTPLNDILRAWHRVQGEYINLGLFGCLAPLALASLVCTWRRSPVLLVINVLAVGAAFAAVCASNCPWQHYYNMFLSGAFFFLAVGIVDATPYLRAAEPLTRWLLQLSMLATVVLAIAPRVESERAGYGTRVSPPPPRNQSWGSLDVVLAHSAPGDRIVTTGAPLIYVQADRLSALRESGMLDPIMNFYVGDTDAERLRPLHDELVKNRPKVVILDPEFASAKVRYRASLWEPFLAEQHYTRLTDTIYLRPD